MPAPSLVDRLKTAYHLVNDTIDEYSRDRADLLAAALAFYTLLSLAPLIIVAVAIASVVLGTETARAEIAALLTRTMGTEAANTVNAWVDASSASGTLASVVGFALVLFAASRLISQLRSALNQTWNVEEAAAPNFQSSVKGFLRERLFAFALVFACGPLLLIVFLSRAFLTGLHGVLFDDSPVAGVFVQITQLLFSLVLVAVMTALVFRVVPNRRLGWRSIRAGALLTSFMFNVGNVLVGLYLGRATVAAAYGAAGSLVVVLLWINFSASMFLFGAEFTQVHAKHLEKKHAPPGERNTPPPERVQPALDERARTAQ